MKKITLLFVLLLCLLCLQTGCNIFGTSDEEEKSSDPTEATPPDTTGNGDDPTDLEEETRRKIGEAWVTELNAITESYIYTEDMLFTAFIGKLYYTDIMSWNGATPTIAVIIQPSQASFVSGEQLVTDGKIINFPCSAYPQSFLDFHKLLQDLGSKWTGQLHNCLYMGPADNMVEILNSDGTYSYKAMFRCTPRYSLYKLYILMMEP